MPKRKHTRRIEGSHIRLIQLNSLFRPSDFSSDQELAVNDFMQNNAGHAAHFTGYKTWKSGDDVKVKVYVSHDGMNMGFNYTCHKHGATIECHAHQPGDMRRNLIKPGSRYSKAVVSTIVCRRISYRSSKFYFA